MAVALVSVALVAVRVSTSTLAALISVAKRLVAVALLSEAN